MQCVCKWCNREQNYVLFWDHSLLKLWEEEQQKTECDVAFVFISTFHIKPRGFEMIAVSWKIILSDRTSAQSLAR